ncbi:4Fe-4S binding protein [bacterium]|nr:4Fe-4S binding protein [bacterium]
MSDFAKRIVVLLIPATLALAWVGGEMRKQGEMGRRLSHISADITQVRQLDQDLYQARRKSTGDTLFITSDSYPSYGGPLTVATAVDKQKTILYTAILESTDTRSYLEKVVGFGILNVYTGVRIDQMPKLDGISGATISSTAITRGIEASANKIGVAEFGMPAIGKEDAAATPETAKLLLIVFVFAAALFLVYKDLPRKKQLRAGLLLFSVVTMGFLFGTLFSMSTVVSFISGTWLEGLASYSAMLCMVLAIVTFLVTRKKVYCTYICPFGAVQEGLGKITGCKGPEKYPWMEWISRFFVWAILVAALYFQTPSDAMYEPFSKAFNFIGSGILYGLTILIVIASLVIKRPWCNLFCPASSIFFYLRFARKAFAPKSTADISNLPLHAVFNEKSKKEAG